MCQQCYDIGRCEREIAHVVMLDYFERRPHRKSYLRTAALRDRILLGNYWFQLKKKLYGINISHNSMFELPKLQFNISQRYVITVLMYITLIYLVDGWSRVVALCYLT